MNIEELRYAIETYPQCLASAMEEVAQAEQAIEKLEDQIAEEEARLSPESEESYTDHVEDKQSDEDYQQKLVKIEYELSLLELRCEQIKGEIELEYRRNPPANDKVTEATVTAYVKRNTLLVEAKERCLEKKYERDSVSLQADMARRAEYAAERVERMERRKSEQPVEPVTSPTLDRLNDELEEANITFTMAQRNLEVVKASIVPYQLLVQLYTAGLIKE